MHNCNNKLFYYIYIKLKKTSHTINTHAVRCTIFNHGYVKFHYLAQIKRSVEPERR